MLHWIISSIIVEEELKGERYTEQTVQVYNSCFNQSSSDVALSYNIFIHIQLPHSDIFTDTFQ